MIPLCEDLETKLAKINDIEDVKTWIAAHDAKNDAWWDEQRRWNVLHNDRIGMMEGRLAAVEKRVIWLAAAAAAGGGVAGNMLQGLFG